MAEEIPWKPDNSYPEACRAESAIFDGHELVVYCETTNPVRAANFTWQVFGPDDCMRPIEDGDCASIDEAKARAVEALERIMNSGPHPE